MDTKKCVKCKIVKPLNEFNFRKRSKDGYSYYCKECHNQRNREWRESYPEKNRASRAKCRESYQKYYLENREKICAKQAEYRKKNPAKAVERYRLWRKANPEKFRAIGRRAHQKRRSTLKGRMHARIRWAVRKMLHGGKGGRKLESVVGFTTDQLIKNMEKKFTKGMTLALLKEGKIHIDHKIPVKVFNFEKPEDDDFKKCWSLNNLQPLWAKDNLSKGAKLDKHFQPSLVF